MAICQNGAMEGSVSGGCVEGAVHETAQQVMTEARPQLVRFGVSNDDAWAVGLTCGGKIAVYVEPLPPRIGSDDDTPMSKLAGSLLAERPVLLATVVEGSGQGNKLLVETSADKTKVVGSLGHAALDQQVQAMADEQLAAQRSELRTMDFEADSSEVFLHALPPRKRLVVVGAVHVAIPLLHFASQLGFRTIVVDPRTAFATTERFPHADELHTEWPDEALKALELNESSFVALLSHDLKLDIPSLEVALRRPVRYLGALGSRKTHHKRVTALEERGFGADEIARIHNPIGLDLGGRRAEEIAVAIMAEMVAVDHGRSGRP